MAVGGWRGWGYFDLAALGLEPGMTEAEVCKILERYADRHDVLQGED